MLKKNPFPGMNPYFEERWSDAHSRMITYINDFLGEALPDDLVAGAEEQAIAIGGDDTPPTRSVYRPDISVREPWEVEDYRDANEADAGSKGVAVAEPSTAPPTPMRILIDDPVDRWIEIHDLAGRLITVIELLSPSNKEGFEEREAFRRKRRTFMAGGVSVVEIDLVRRGISPVPPEAAAALRDREYAYSACVFASTALQLVEVYGIRLQERLPAIPIPLRPGEQPVILKLQPLIDRCHERGRYHRLNYDAPLVPPMIDADAEWLDLLLREKGLRQ